jgi:hypothetical protein
MMHSIVCVFLRGVFSPGVSVALSPTILLLHPSSTTSAVSRVAVKPLKTTWQKRQTKQTQFQAINALEKELKTATMDKRQAILQKQRERQKQREDNSRKSEQLQMVPMDA